MKSVRGIVFLVTGRARGIGKLGAEHFAADGAKVVLRDKDREILENTICEFLEKGWDAFSYVADITDRSAVYDTASRVKNEVGLMDVLMNNAGIVRGGLFLETPDEDHLATMDVYYNAVMHFTDCMRCEMKRYRKTGVRFTIVCPSYVETGMFEGAKAQLPAPWLEPEVMVDKIYIAYNRNKKTSMSRSTDLRRGRR